MISSSPAPRRIVITGLGLITPLGITKESLWAGLVEGRSGVAPATTWTPCGFAGEAREFSGSIDDFGPLEGEKKKAVRKGLKVMCRESQMGVAAAQRAIADAGIVADGFDPERAGVVFGSDYMLTMPEEFTASIKDCMSEPDRFEFSQWASRGLAKMPPLWLLKYLPNMPASHIAIYNDFRGPNNSITMREAASNLAIGEAFRVIQRNHADMIVAGATGTRVHPMNALHAAQQEELATDGHGPAAAARPFDLDRSGMVLGEGAGAIVLEELQTALKRGATIYGEVIGAGSSSVAAKNFVAHRETALRNAMRSTLRDAKASPADVGHIQAHGLSTHTSDVAEARALAEILGDRLARVPVTAAKSYFGNLGAGSGVIELIAGTLALRDGTLFPILNYQTPDPACPISAAIGSGIPAGETFLNLSVTPQGQASCVMVRRYG
jgi:3-oxoacyl-[acyl-carrier-protein] synthase II